MWESFFVMASVEVLEEEEAQSGGEREEAEAVEYFPNYRPIKNTNKRFTIIAEENAKEALKELDTKRESYAQRLSRLYGTGSDSDIIKSDIQRRKRHEVALNLDRYQSAYSQQEEATIPAATEPKEPNEQRLLQMTDSLAHSTKGKHLPEPSRHSGALYNQYSLGDWKGSVCTRAQTESHPHLRTHTAMYLLDRCGQGRYAVPLSPSPYDSKFLVCFRSFSISSPPCQAEPQKSAHTTTTPLEWKIKEKREANEKYSRDLEEGLSHCTKSSLSGQCGGPSLVPTTLL